MVNPTIKLYLSPIKERNIEKYGEHSAQCFCCGKPMAEGLVHYVHMNTFGEVVHPSIDENDVVKLTGAESQGCFPVGNECAKKMKGYTLQLYLDVTHPEFKK